MEEEKAPLRCFEALGGKGCIKKSFSRGCGHLKSPEPP